jgi:membrane protein YdbS with pleckstrin-like domain
MAGPDQEARVPVWAVAAAVGAFAVCCAGPVLLALVATTGVAAALAHGAAPIVTAAGLVATLVVGAILWRRRTWACKVRRPASRPEHRQQAENAGASPDEIA